MLMMGLFEASGVWRWIQRMDWLASWFWMLVVGDVMGQVSVKDPV